MYTVRQALDAQPLITSVILALASHLLGPQAVTTASRKFSLECGSQKLSKLNRGVCFLTFFFFSEIVFFSV